MQLKLHQDIARPAQAVWDYLSNFANVPWMLGVVDRVETVGEGIGMQRKLYRKHLSVPVVQRLDALDHDSLKMSYSLVSGPATTIKHWAITLTIVPVSAGASRVDADLLCELPPYANVDDVRVVVQSMMAMFFQRLQELLETPED